MVISFPANRQKHTEHTHTDLKRRELCEMGEWSDGQNSNVIHIFNTLKLLPSFLLPVEENVMSLADDRQWPGAWYKANETETRSTHTGLIAPLVGYSGTIGLQLVFVKHSNWYVLIRGRTDSPPDSQTKQYLNLTHLNMSSDQNISPISLLSSEDAAIYRTCGQTAGKVFKNPIFTNTRTLSIINLKRY